MCNLDHSYHKKVIKFELLKKRKKLIKNWDVKIEERKNEEDSFSSFTISIKNCVYFNLLTIL
jgi:hypothetical protein